LITVSNHDATIDDPVLFGLLNWKTLASERLRYSLGAQEICFKNAFLSRFFSAGRVIPIVRGSGIYQRGMDHAIEVLNNNGWIHLFPEGKVNLDYYNMIKFRWGVGRLIEESHVPPIVVPFYHRGMADIRPEKYKWGVKFGKELRVLFGKPIDTADYSFSHLDPTQRRIQVTKVLEDQVLCLKDQLEQSMVSKSIETLE
jgi:monolysocardiolipin acyltransferase